jgi:ankyrin repeat protein
MEAAMVQEQTAFELLAAGDEPGLRRLVETTPAAAEARDPSGVSLLMHALYHGYRDLAASIADRKAGLDVFESASLARLEQLQKALQDPAAANAFSADGFTALHFASYFSQPKSARLLLEHGASPESVANNPMRVMPLHSAASARNLEGARLLLQHGAPVNARQHGGWAPIHAAAQNGDIAMLELLLKHGADPHAANDDGKSPADVAREKGHTDIVSRLEMGF